jgi:coenzyme F420-reducing hydrogenase gamma subunit
VIPKTKRLWAKQLLLPCDLRSSSSAYSLLYALSLLHGPKMVVNIGSCASTRRYEGLAEILPSSKALILEPVFHTVTLCMASCPNSAIRQY